MTISLNHIIAVRIFKNCHYPYLCSIGEMVIMVKRRLIVLILLIQVSVVLAQKRQLARPMPRLVVGLVVDQMRWDYLTRFQERFGNRGFKRMLKEGFSCDNTMIPYAQTVTAAGHATIYTGSVPSIHGIIGNDWYDKLLQKQVYCVQDDSVRLLGTDKRGNLMSPKNLLTTTITDELKLATNFRSKVIGVAIKDRGSILPAGHTPNAAYWYDATSGNFITSSWYMNELAPWVTIFNNRKIVDSLYRNPWSLSYPISSYTQSDTSDNSLKNNPFPRNLDGNIGKSYGSISSTPSGVAITLAFSQAAIEAEHMGEDSIPDFLTISLSSTDYIGHAFGPNAVEIEDAYIKLDQELASFFDYLDDKVGKGKYTFFLTADHAVAHVTAFMEQHKLPGKSMKKNLLAVASTEKKFGLTGIIADELNGQYYLNSRLLDSAKIDLNSFKSFFLGELNKSPDVLVAYDNGNIQAVNLPSELKEMFIKGYNFKLSGDIQVVYKPGYFFGGATGSTHGSMYAYDAHIPLLWMGCGIKQGNSHREIYMTDIAPTLAALLGIQQPSGSIGKVINEIIK